jgi:hypothetical protein
VRAASAAFGRGDLSTLQNQYVADNIIWHIADTGPLAGDYEGIAQVMGVLGKPSARITVTFAGSAGVPTTARILDIAG